jgi:hypothetical protein
MLALCSINLTSCSDDDDDLGSGNSGTFKPDAELYVDGVSKKLNLIQTFHESERGISNFEIKLESEEVAFTITLNSIELVELEKNSDLKNESAYFTLYNLDGLSNFKSASLFKLTHFNLEKEEMTIEFEGAVIGKKGEPKVKGKVSTNFKRSNGITSHVLVDN